MSDGSEKRPLTKMRWSVSIKTRTFAAVNTCNGSFCLKLLNQYRTIEQMCSDAHSITLMHFKCGLFVCTLIYWWIYAPCMYSNCCYCIFVPPIAG